MSTMFPDRAKYRIRYKGLESERGVSIVAAIFLLLLMAGLSTLMATFLSVQHATSAQDIQGSRAYQAAHAGVEWGIYRALAGTCVASVPLPALENDLQQFRVIVQCTVTSTSEGGVAVNVYRIASTANSGTVGKANYVERMLEVTV